ncbi:hypothetical protein KW790_00085 [Candidatus Parcubacteria bacterium]|nr:hypothetical protein [Candidatus Parcubacteria bacterium]
MKTQSLKPQYELKEFDRPLFIAAHFGFTPIDPPKVSDKDISMTRDCMPKEENSKNLFDALEKAAFIRTYVENGFANLPHPTGFAWKKGESYSLELVGFPLGLAEALLIRSALSILEESGHKELVVEINCMGDKDSITCYERELHAYVRKIQNVLSVEFKKLIKEDVFKLLSISKEDAPVENADPNAREKEVDWRDNIPPSMASLSTTSRAQFREVLAHLESLGVEFRLTPSLLGNKNFCSDSLFIIRDTTTHALLSLGYRYSRLSRRFGFKKELPLIGVSVFPTPREKKIRLYSEMPKPKFYLVQLGREAKMKALPLIELLRTQRIPVYHYLGRDKLTPQLSTAETLRVPYLLIIGHKEALDGTVTVRNMQTRAQDTVCLRDLPEFLKHLPF